MKRVLIILFFIETIYANNFLEQKEFFNKLFETIFQKKIIKVYVTDPKYREIFENSKFQIVLNCDDSDFVFDGNPPCKKYHFVLDYKEFKKDPLAFGAFYWRKGRPQLIFKSKLLKQINPKALKWLKNYLD